MYAIINCSYDGDNYQLFSELSSAQAQFNDSLEVRAYHAVYLLGVQVGVEFGFGNRGEIYGAEILEEWVAEEC
jgi:hypothetical protein